MLRRISRRILYGWMGFRAELEVAIPRKCVIALAPHTSNWDFIVGTLFCRAEGLRCEFLMKSDWFFWPVGILMRRLGGIPVHRGHHTGITDAVAARAREASDFRLCVTPEGTRQANSDWKLGFYYIALKAGVPVCLFGLDYRERRIVCSRLLVPDGDAERQMAEVKAYYRNFTGRHPRKFAI